MYSVDLKHPSEISGAESLAWRMLQAEGGELLSSPLLGPDFTGAVGEVRKDARVAIWREEGTPIGFLPHHRRPTGFGRPIGAPLCDYHALIAAPRFRASADEILHGARLRAFRVSGLLGDRSWCRGEGVRTHTLAYRIQLEGSGSDYMTGMSARSANRAKNHRRSRRKLERDLGEVRLAAPDWDPSAFHNLLSWKRVQLQRSGLHDFLRPEWTQALLHRLFKTRDGPFQGLMINLYAGDRHVAGHFGVRLQHHYHPWIAAMRPGLDAYGPGFLHQWEAIEAMSGLGLTIYDLGPGSDHWKRLFTATTTQVGAGLITSPSLGGRMAALGERIWAVPPLDRLELAGRAQSRLDQIAAMEVTVAGRLRGLVGALAAYERRTVSRRTVAQAAALRER